MKSSFRSAFTRDGEPMFQLNSLYRPLIATPFSSSRAYSEISPCDALKPYIVCFWGSPEPYENEGRKTSPAPAGHGLVIPDTCMDIIFNFNHTTGEASSCFCGLNDEPFTTGRSDQAGRLSIFGIRFHFWAVQLFAGRTLLGSSNISDEVDAFFNGWTAQLMERFSAAHTLQERARLVEPFLMAKLNGNRMNADVFNAAYRILQGRGTLPAKEICAYTGVSQRQLERLFAGRIGISVKTLSTLVRFQTLWRDVLRSETFDVQEAVVKYRYTDQSHLLHEFKKFHGVTPAQARARALNIITPEQ